MTTTASTPSTAAMATPGAGRRTQAAPGRVARALGARRWFLVAAPILAGVFATLGAYADPGAGLSGEAMWGVYAAEPDALQVKSLAFHWSYAFWIAPALLIAPYVRSRGAWLANVTALVGFVGMTTMPGLLLSDWFDSAIGQLYGVEGTASVNQLMADTMWGVPLFTLPGLVGLVLALPLTALTLWRAGLARWWALLPVLAGFAAFTFSGVTWWGCALATAFFAVFAGVLHRATDPARQLG